LTITANAIEQKVDIKSKIRDELGKVGVNMSELCEVKIDDDKFEKKALDKHNAAEHIKELVEDLKPKQQKVIKLVRKLNQQRLVLALVNFSVTVLVNELQVVGNFPSWVGDEKAITLNNVR
jgi:hypothetical protein